MSINEQESSGGNDLKLAEQLQAAQEMWESRNENPFIDVPFNHVSENKDPVKPAVAQRVYDDESAPPGTLMITHQKAAGIVTVSEGSQPPVSKAAPHGQGDVVTTPFSVVITIEGYGKVYNNHKTGVEAYELSGLNNREGLCRGVHLSIDGT